MQYMYTVNARVYIPPDVHTANWSARVGSARQIALFSVAVALGDTCRRQFGTNLFALHFRGTQGFANSQHHIYRERN